MRSVFSSSDSSELDIPLRLLKVQREQEQHRRSSTGTSTWNSRGHNRTLSIPEDMLLVPNRTNHRSGSPPGPLPIVGEDCVITPSASPVVPREVVWERKFGSFLRKNSSGPPTSLLPPLGTVKRNRSSGSNGSTATTGSSPLTCSPPDAHERVSTTLLPKLRERSVRAGKLFANANFFTHNNTKHDDELDGTLRRGERKKVFTNFHNESLGSGEAPFLGEGEHSTHAGFMWTTKTRHAETKPLSRSLERFPSTHRNPIPPCVLRPVVGVDTWKSGHRYLILPAILATCDDATLEYLWPSSFQDPVETSTLRDAIDLGENCWVQNGRDGWQQIHLVLRHNYLLEYGIGSKRPRGYCHLAGATVSLHADFPDTLTLDYYCNPCSSSQSERRTLLVRVGDRDNRIAYKECLERAVQCAVQDLYDLDESGNNGACLGEGEYAVVKAGKRRHDGQPCALKIFDKAKFWKRVVKGHERADTIVREAAVQSTLAACSDKDAPLVQIRGVLETKEQVILEMELLEGATDLFHYVSSSGTALAEHEAARILWDVMVALRIMNETGVAHRDVKPSNILVTTTPLQAKLCDFGMSTFVEADGHIRGRCGTPGTFVPQIVGFSHMFRSTLLL